MSGAALRGFVDRVLLALAIGIFKQWARCPSMLHYLVFIIRHSVNHTSIIILIGREAKQSNYSYQLGKEGVRAVVIE